MTQFVRRIGIFGGSFDPPHNGHYICARAAAEHLSLEKVFVIPAALQPLKPSGAMASREVRLQMVEATFGADPIFEISTLELDKGGNSYTIDTIRHMKQLYPVDAASLFLIVGADTLADMPNWKEPDEIFRLATVASMVRTGSTLPMFPPSWNVQVIQLDTPMIDISSRDIRQRVAAGQIINSLIPREVQEIIKEESLYIMRESARLA